MNKLIIAICLIIVSGCDNSDTFSGYLVGKEFIPEHMDDESPIVTNYAIVVVPHHSPNKINAEWRWYVANKCEVRQFSVAESVFQSKKCGDKVIMNLK